MTEVGAARRVQVGATPNAARVRSQLRFNQNAVGAVPSPFDCYLCQRGLKTLQVRPPPVAAARMPLPLLRLAAAAGRCPLPSPDWLAARPQLRFEAHCRNALAVARALEASEKCTRVAYPGLPSHPQVQGPPHGS